MTTLDEIEAIKQLKARYFRFLDAKDWDRLREVFTDDVVVDTSAVGGKVVTGVHEYLEFLRAVLEGTVTVHHGHMPEIEVTSGDEATGIWALHDIVIWASGARLDGFGHYHEHYRRLPGGWRIASSTLTRLHVDLTGAANG